MTKNQIILIGPKGCGKTTIGNLLSKQLTYKWIDIDSFLHNHLKFPSSQTYTKEQFKQKQNIEIEILKQSLNLTNIVISTGEGLIINQTQENLNTLKNILKQTTIIFLNPIKNTKSEFSEFANRTILTKNKTPEQIIQEISSL